MTKIVVGEGSASPSVAEVDEDNLRMAQEMLGTESPQDTVNQALREVVRRRLVHEYISLLQAAESSSEDDRNAAWL